MRVVDRGENLWATYEFLRCVPKRNHVIPLMFRRCHSCFWVGCGYRRKHLVRFQRCIVQWRWEPPRNVFLTLVIAKNETVIHDTYSTRGKCTVCTWRGVYSTRRKTWQMVTLVWLLPPHMAYWTQRLDLSRRANVCPRVWLPMDPNLHVALNTIGTRRYKVWAVIWADGLNRLIIRQLSADYLFNCRSAIIVLK